MDTMRCPICAQPMQFGVSDSDPSVRKELNGRSKMRGVIWKQGPPEKATLIWVNSIKMTLGERSWITYSKNDETKDGTAADKKPEALYKVKFGWDYATKQWTSVFDGACWEIFTTRFGTTGSTEDTALAAGLARLIYALNRKSPDDHAMPLGVLIGSGNLQYIPPGTVPEPRRPRTPEEIFQESGIQLDVLEDSIEKLIRLGQNPINQALVEEFNPSHRRSAAPGRAMRQPHHLGVFHYRRLKTLGIDPYKRPQPHIMASGQLCEPCRVDIFSQFPQELLLCILPHVNFSDLPNLRLASRPVAAVSALGQLPTSYWKARFLNSYPYAVPATMGEAPDWRALCFAMEPLFRPRWGTAFWGGGSMTRASGRASIWHRLLFLGDLICRTPQGFPVDMADWKGMTADLEAKWRPRRQSVRLVRGQLHEKQDSGPEMPLIVRRSPWVTRDYRLRGIGVTTTRLGRWMIITGIRLFHQVDGSKVYASDELGYTSFASETVFPVAENEDLRSIRVIYSNNGGAVTGIKFVLSNKYTRVSRTTDWIDASVNRIPSSETLATIHRSCPMLPFTIIGRFDYCGLVGLSMLGASIVSSRSKRPPRDDSRDDLPVRPKRQSTGPAIAQRPPWRC